VPGDSSHRESQGESHGKERIDLAASGKRMSDTRQKYRYEMPGLSGLLLFRAVATSPNYNQAVQETGEAGAFDKQPNGTKGEFGICEAFT
jgi:hypothetical protein